MNIAIIISRFNKKITSLMEENSVIRADELNVNYQIYYVPGAIEIPLTAKKLALKDKFDAIVTLGAVIRGETTHYDYVCNNVSIGCQKISLKHKIPIIFGVLTCENEAQALDRIIGKKGNKPKEMIDTAIEMIELIRKIDAE